MNGRSVSLVVPLVALLFNACGHKAGEPAASREPVTSQPPSPSGSRIQAELTRIKLLPHEHDVTRRPVFPSRRAPDRREWVFQTLQDGYVATCRTNAAWDAVLKKTFAAFADYSRRENSLSNYAALTNAIVAASARGCNDPMLQYMRARYGLEHPTADAEQTALDYLAADRAMWTSRYHPQFKFFAGWRAAAAAREAEPSSDRTALLEQTTLALEDLARDTNAPAGEVLESAEQWINYDQNSGATENLQPLLEKYWSKEPAFFRIMGQAEITRAWEARGGGYADTVSDKGWQSLGTHLNMAEAYL